MPATASTNNAAARAEPGRRPVLAAALSAGLGSGAAARGAPAAAPVGTIRARDGVGLFHRDWGGAGRPPVVFVASWSLPSDSWAYQMLALSEAGLRCVAYDRRGHGRSDDPGRGFDFDTLADDLAAVLEALDLRARRWWASSMGAGRGRRLPDAARAAAGRVRARRARRRHDADAGAGGRTTPAAWTPPCSRPSGGTSLMRDFPGWIDANMVPFVTPDTPPGLARTGCGTWRCAPRPRRCWSATAP
jgi:pimeloyl-ACP methyl ester carboxylesterase